MTASYGLFVAINISFGFGLSSGNISNGTNQSVSTGLIRNEVLPSCVYSWLFEPVTAFCGDKSVPDIIDSREDKTDPKFTGCLLSFPDQYKNANFSILIKDLRVDDAGLYQCHIHKLGYQSKITGTNQSVSTGLIRNEVLPSCVYSWLFEPVTAFCGDKSVPDIIDSREDKTDPKFTGCLLSFPDQYKNANFSIPIKDLRVDDAGLYQCHIHKLGYQSKITDTREIEMRPVKNATLQCSLPSVDAIMPICHGGAELGDPEMKHGNISVFSKNIAINDSAKCQVPVSRDGDATDSVFEAPTDTGLLLTVKAAVQSLIRDMIQSVVDVLVMAVFGDRFETVVKTVVKTVFKTVVEAVVEAVVNPVVETVVDAVMKAVTEALDLI